MKIDILPSLFSPKSELKVVSRLEDQLKGGINSRRGLDIERATRLAVYWDALGFRKKSISLLESFENKVVFNRNNMGLWCEYGYSLVFLRDLLGFEDGASEALLQLLDEDIIAGSRVEHFKYHMDKGLPESLSQAELESQKHQCEIYSGEILQLLYHKHMLKLEDSGYWKEVITDVEIRLLCVKKYLSEALVERRVSNVDRMAIHPQD